MIIAPRNTPRYFTIIIKLSIGNVNHFFAFFNSFLAYFSANVEITGDRTHKNCFFPLFPKGETDSSPAAQNNRGRLSHQIPVYQGVGDRRPLRPLGGCLKKSLSEYDLDFLVQSWLCAPTFLFFSPLQITRSRGPSPPGLRSCPSGCLLRYRTASGSRDPFRQTGRSFRGHQSCLPEK